MKCTFCGAEMDDSAKFCVNCGRAKAIETESFQEEKKQEAIQKSETAEVQTTPENDLSEQMNQYENGGGLQSGQYQNDNQGAPYGQKANQGGNGFSVASLVLGIIGVVCGGLICGVLAIVFSNSSKRRIGDRTGIANAGLVLGIISIVKVAIVVVLVLLGILALTQNYTDFNQIIEHGGNLAIMPTLWM